MVLVMTILHFRTWKMCVYIYIHMCVCVYVCVCKFFVLKNQSNGYEVVSHCDIYLYFPTDYFFEHLITLLWFLLAIWRNVYFKGYTIFKLGFLLLMNLRNSLHILDINLLLDRWLTKKCPILLLPLFIVDTVDFMYWSF